LKGCIEYFLTKSDHFGSGMRLLDGGASLPELHAFRPAFVPFLLRFLQPSTCLTSMADSGRYLDSACQFEVCGLICHCLMNKDWGDFNHFWKLVIIDLKRVHLVEFNFKLATELVQRIGHFFANASRRAT
jgi:hypothetical protein